VFSAHGVPKSVRAEAEARGLRVFDATCPLVTKVHSEVETMRAHGREIVMIGHAGHPEVEGTMGNATAASIWSNRSPMSIGSPSPPATRWRM
jgi:4-hydroxy-3-methylbut-2-enyl diphosphate reductase